jgi:hypothetical protein
LVAATACSGPATVSITSSAASASGESPSLVMARVNAPWRRPSSTTLMMSGDCPDCETATTSESPIFGGFLKTLNIDGAARATGMPLEIPQRYLA